MDAVVVWRGISFLRQNKVTLFYSGPGRGASDPRVLVLSSEASLLMAVLQVFSDFLHLTEIYTLVSDEVM